ncbi:MAG: ArnT family glycosyltransferase [Bdellovibrionales bacterium]
MDKAKKILWICLGIKLVLAVFLPFFFDENYYWFWSHNLRLSYFDHPPMVGVLFWFGRIFEDLGGAARWPGVVLSQATICIWLLVLQKFTDKKEHLVHFALLMSFWPIFGFGAVVITPDTPVFFFWALSSLWLLKSLDQPSAINYSLFGLFLGLGGASKYHMVLALLAFLIYICWGKKWKSIEWKYLPLAVIAALLAISPVLIWNYQNNWDSFLFQLNHGLGAKSWKPIWTIDYVWTQIVFVFPAVIYIAFRNFNKKYLFLFVLAAFPMLFFLLTSFKGRVEGNWPMVAYPAIGMLAVLQSTDFKKWFKYAVTFWVLIFVVVYSNAFYYWLPVEQTKTKFREFNEYEDLLVVARSYTPAYADSYQMASYLSYKLKTDILKLKSYNRKDFYDYLPESKPSEERFYFLVETQVHKLPDYMKNYKITLKVPINARYQVIEFTRDDSKTN